ncbi:MULTISPECIES: YifB family Mg chelatase-like AAA ATPase [Actinomyces]|uniref:YifB family Mg chelatase-like AAA ATPase n=1 Tax=Actinomyces respiraculi TaxID=2744574 RepID=A0A7T0LN48_9ACTO|nr:MULTISPECIES: YifB family Mg chelatase-like AAA ATPase [Actinomyces]QPL06213.1 YifB family Mg chelatase-like AAA ATPase [Actinomyces respiraculi]
MSGLARTLAVTLTGLEGHLVDVEAHAAGGLPSFTLVGLPDAAVRESRERVRAALSTCGTTWGEKRLTVNLSPADLPKTGTGFDVSLALAVLAARGDLPARALPVLARTLFIGELGLDASIRPVRGVLPAVRAAVGAGVTTVVVPADCTAEASLVPGARVTGARHLASLITALGGRLPAEVLALAEAAEPRRSTPAQPTAPAGTVTDLADVVGQDEARHALEVAAAGGHHLLLVGPPGAGKTMLAERLPSILPALEDDDAVTVTSLHSVAGAFDPEHGLIRTPPLRAPHHTATRAAVIGGGSGLPRPGDVSLAHRGVLLLDEAPEFPAGVLDCLRQPLESGRVTIDRAGGRATYPAAFQLVLAANPCPCGKGSGRALECTCTSLQRRRYFSRLSGPLLDRVDIQLEVGPVSAVDLGGGATGEPSAAVAARVAEARRRTARRLEGTPWRLMGEVPGSWVRERTTAEDPRLVARLMDALDRGDLSLRGVDRVLRLAWTLADLAGEQRPGATELGTALSLRTRGAQR